MDLNKPRLTEIDQNTNIDKIDKMDNYEPKWTKINIYGPK